MGPLLLTIVSIVLIGYTVFGIVIYFMQSSFLYYPVREIYYTPGDLGLTFEKVVFKSSDGLRLSGWYIPSKNSEFTVLFCHGNGGNMMHCLDSIKFFNELGLNFFIFDYRGYGSSEGRPCEEGTYLDAGAAYKWLTEEKKVKPETIIVFGWSLGGSIAAKLASEVRVKALVIESTFTSYVDIGQKFYSYMPVRWFAEFNYNTIGYIRNVRCPVMIIHSRNDEIVPFEFGIELYKAANEPKEFVEVFGSHNESFVVSGEIYKKAWVKWLEFLGENKVQAGRQQLH
jgi:hypothetical protein